MNKLTKSILYLVLTVIGLVIFGYFVYVGKVL